MVDVFLIRFFEFSIFTFTESDDGFDVEVNSDMFSSLNVDLAQLFIFRSDIFVIMLLYFDFYE